MKKFLISFSIFGLVVLPTLVSAHVSVKPSEAPVGARVSFSMGVPVEKDIPTIALRLVIPEGLESVTPHVKPGWKIDIKKDKDVVTEISWTGGTIPPGQRDEFLFSAKVPGNGIDIQWKAYQTYRDGTVVAWDQDPTTINEDDESGASGPYSTTKVLNDLETSAKADKTIGNKENSFIPVVAIAMSGLALAMQLFVKKSA